MQLPPWPNPGRPSWRSRDNDRDDSRNPPNRDETHDIFLGLKSRDELDEKTMREPLPIPACRQQLHKRHSCSESPVPSRARYRLSIAATLALGLTSRRDNSRYAVMAARSAKTQNMKFSMLAVLTSWKTCNAHVDQSAAVFFLNKNNRQFERQLSGW